MARRLHGVSTPSPSTRTCAARTVLLESAAMRRRKVHGRAHQSPSPCGTRPAVEPSPRSRLTTTTRAATEQPTMNHRLVPSSGHESGLSGTTNQPTTDGFYGALQEMTHPSSGRSAPTFVPCSSAGTTHRPRSGASRTRPPPAPRGLADVAGRPGGDRRRRRLTVFTPPRRRPVRPPVAIPRGNATAGALDPFDRSSQCSTPTRLSSAPARPAWR